MELHLYYTWQLWELIDASYEDVKDFANPYTPVPVGRWKFRFGGTDKERFYNMVGVVMNHGEYNGMCIYRIVHSFGGQIRDRPETFIAGMMTDEYWCSEVNYSPLLDKKTKTSI